MCSSDAPDMSGANAAALQQANLSKEQLDWMKQIYAETAPDRKAATDRANYVSDKQLEAMDLQSKLTKDYSDYQSKVFRPLETGIVKEAENYDTKERRDAEAAKAVSDVNQAFGAARDATSRNMQRMGVNPASGAFAAGQQQLDAQKALATVQGITGARDKVQTLGYARKMDAANLGRNLASNQATSAGVALNQGNSAVANGQVGLSVANQGAQMMNSGYAGAQQGLAGAANTYTNIAGIQQKAGDNSGVMGAVGNFAGQAFAAGKLFGVSDKNQKENVEQVDPDQALEAIEKTPVSEWQYKGSSFAADHGMRHIGPMAQDVQKNMGEKAAPGGKQIDLVSMNGTAMAAIQALSKKVDSIAASQGIGYRKSK